MQYKDIKIVDFTYHLPEEKIAFEPLQQRDTSKLLVYNNAKIIDEKFENIYNYLPENSLIVFNNSKVIPARLLFKNSNGASIEIFCLEPTINYTEALQQKNIATWKCFIGNVKKWREEILEFYIEEIDTKIQASIQQKNNDNYLVHFNWNTNFTFAEILEAFGKIPLPPYIKRESNNNDKITYQTIYAKEQGSVAAPTAGLHFTENILQKIISKNIQPMYLTLHVGAGTFKPVKTTTLQGHNMHAEWMEIDQQHLKELLQNDYLTSVGTTSLRTLESIYWLGVKCILYPEIELKNLKINQWEVYEELQNSDISKQQSLEALINFMQIKNVERFFTTTQIIIVPGYFFKIVNQLITNFHQPQSTLLLIIAAIVGKNWKNIYEHALQNNYRFLSYGDSSVYKLITNNEKLQVSSNHFNSKKLCLKLNSK